MTWLLASLLAVAIVALVWSVHGWVGSMTATANISDMYRAMSKRCDEQTIEIASLKQQLAQAKTLAAIAQKQRNDATASATKATVEKIKAASPKDAAAIVNAALPADVTITEPAPVRLADAMMTELK